MPLAVSHREALIAACPLFRDLDADGMAAVAQAAVEVEFPAERTIAHQGEIGTGLFIVAEGAVRVVRDGEVIAHARTRRVLRRAVGPRRRAPQRVGDRGRTHDMPCAGHLGRRAGAAGAAGRRARGPAGPGAAPPRGHGGPPHLGTTTREAPCPGIPSRRRMVGVPAGGAACSPGVASPPAQPATADRRPTMSDHARSLAARPAARLVRGRPGSVSGRGPLGPVAFRAYGRFNRDARLILVTSLVTGAVVSLWWIDFNLYLVALGYSTATIGLVATLASVAGAIIAFPGQRGVGPGGTPGDLLRGTHRRVHRPRGAPGAPRRWS